MPVGPRTLILLLLVCAKDFVHSSTLTAGEKDCRERGYDVTQLACSTCTLLPAQSQTDCLDCCQMYLETQNTRKQPYQIAILLVPQQAGTVGRMTLEGEDMEQFLSEDWPKLTAQKGVQRLRRVGVQNSFRSVLYFFDTDVKEVNAVTLQKAAETIDLHGWKRDDIRDMISSLLPDE